MHPDLNHSSLKNRVILITGGSRGLGWTMSDGLLKAGAKLVITGARNKENLATARAKAKKIAGSDHVFVLQADITEWSDCEAVIEKTLDRFGALHVLINNAGRGPIEIDPNFVQRRPKFWETPSDGWRTIIDTNINGSYLMAKAVAPHFIAQGFGKIINVSTSLTNMVYQGSSPYGSSKAALEAASMSWAKDLEGTGVTVNVVEPGGGVDTDLIPGGVVGERTPRLLSPSVMVAPALWLCSDLSNDTTAKRYIAKNWNPDTPIQEGEARARCPSHSQPSIM